MWVFVLCCFEEGVVDMTVIEGLSDKGVVEELSER